MGIQSLGRYVTDLGAKYERCCARVTELIALCDAKDRRIAELEEEVKADREAWMKAGKPREEVEPDG